MKARGKLVSLLTALVCLLPLGAGLLGFGDSASAATPENITVTLHKKKMDDFPTGGIQNTGELMEGDDQFGKYDPMPGVEFTAYDVTEDFYRLLNATGNETEDVYNANVKALMKSFKLADCIAAVEKDKQVTSDADGTAVFANLPDRDENGRYKVYLFEETGDKTTQFSQPVILMLPLYKQSDKTPLKDIHLYPKNQVDNEPEKEITDQDGNKLPDADRYSYDVGKKIYYKASFMIPNQIGEIIKDADGLEVQTRYSKLVFKDNVDIEGVKFEGVHSIKIGGRELLTEITRPAYSTLTPVNDGNKDPYAATGKYAGFELSMSLNDAKRKENPGDFDSSRTVANFLNQYRGQKIEIFYAVSLTEDTPVDVDIKNEFSVAMKQAGGQDDTREADAPPAITTGGKKFLKHEDKVESQGLAGAEFVVIKEVTPGNEFYLKKENGKWVWAAVTGDYDDAYKFVSDKDGKFEVLGLEYETYKLRETKAPAGFNKGDDITFVIDKDSYAGASAETKGVPNVSKGGFLPSTGGIGIVIFLVIGGSLMAFAVNRYRKQQRTA